MRLTICSVCRVLFVMLRYWDSQKNKLNNASQNIADKDMAMKLVKTLKERSDISSLCYIPLNCAIVLYVYDREQCTLPRSLTKLFELFILNAVKRHASIDPKINAIAKLSEPLQKKLNVLGMVAYNGLVADKMVFSYEDWKQHFQIAVLLT